MSSAGHGCTARASHERLPGTRPVPVCHWGLEVPLEDGRAIGRAFANRYRFSSVLE